MFHNYKEVFNEDYGEEKKIRLELNKKQRAFMVRMYQRVYGLDEGVKVCAFPMEKDDGFGGTRLFMHGVVEKVQIHHIVSKRYAREYLGWDLHDINSPYNLIPICPHHHITDKANRYQDFDMWNELVEVLHPDMATAFREYDGTPESFKKVFARRNELTEQGVPYWNDFYTRLLLEKAEYVYNQYLRIQLEAHGEYTDIFPYNTTR